MKNLLQEEENNNKDEKEQRKQQQGGSENRNNNSPSSFIKEDTKASNLTAKLIRLLGPKGRQAAKLMPELVAQLEEEQRLLLLQQQQQLHHDHPSDEESFSQQKKKGGNVIIEKARGRVAFAGEESEDNHHENSLILSIQGVDPTSSIRQKSPNRTTSSPNKNNNNNPHFNGPALARSVVSSWKSWVAVFLKRVGEYQQEENNKTKKENQPQVTVTSGGAATVKSNTTNNTRASSSSKQQKSPSSPLYKVTAWATTSSNNNNNSNSSSQSPLSKSISMSRKKNNRSAEDSLLSIDNENDEEEEIIAYRFKTPIAGSVPVELLELHMRQLKLAQQNNSHQQQTGSSSCLQFWKDKFEGCESEAIPRSENEQQQNDEEGDDYEVRVTSANEARDLDKKANQQFHVDDCSLHNCEVIEDEDIFCFEVTSVEVAEEICRMIHRLCVFNE